MTNREIERKLKEALSRSVPDRLEEILSDCETQKGNVPYMTTKKKAPMFRPLIAACLAIALIAGGSALIHANNNAVASVISLDVNPSIELTVNKNQKVLACTALNQEAAEVLADMDGGADLKDAKLTVAVNAITGTLVRHGYLDSLSSTILISVEDSDTQRAAQLRSELTATVDGVLAEKAAVASVLSQTVQKDTQLQSQAKQNNISTGKAYLIEQIVSRNDTLKFEELALLSVEELRDLLEAGAPGMPIGKDSALQAVLDYEKLSRNDVLRYEVDSELDEKPAHYDVELTTAKGEREYLVDPYTGVVLNPDFESEPHIDLSGFLQKGFSHFYELHEELKNERAFDTKVSLEGDDDGLHYKVEFKIGRFEVEYEFDLLGRILNYDIDENDDLPAVSSQAPSSASQPAAADDIGSEAAKAAALSHAGLPESAVLGLRIERDYDDGRMEYEIEFRANGIEFEYKIDAVTGTVLEHEQDRDD